MLKDTFVTSPYKYDGAATHSTAVRGGDSQGVVTSVAGVAGYHIDQNTFQAIDAASTHWVFTTSASGLNTLNDTQFAGLCMNCHSKAQLNSTAAATSAAGTAGSWKAMTRVHNSVKGWALTTGTGGNVGNKVHAYTCSKCHSTHNSNLPRLLVTNCLDAKHKGRVVSGGSAIGPFSGSQSTSNGYGRFPGGGGGSSASRASASGPWYFGTSAAAPATQTCHDSGTAGGAFSITAEQWNTKSLW
jgi:hypothetical protein